MKDYLYRLTTDKETGPWACFMKIPLKGLSFFYGWGTKPLLLCYDVGLLKRHRLPRPVISVGNITWGGVGKTPLVELIAGYLKERKLKPVILIRGYMPGGSFPFSDEAKILQENLGVPVMVGRNRCKTAQEALDQHTVDTFILDDGFQHWRMARDLDIVAVDATNPFGNGHLIPRGILREPLEHLRRAHIFVLTKTNFGRANVEEIKAKLRTMNPTAPIVETIHQAVGLAHLTDGSQIQSLDFLKGKRVGAFCSIGDPDSFEHLLEDAGCEVVFCVPFRDHYSYEKHDIQSLVKLGREKGVGIFITTQKDEVKLTPDRGWLWDDFSLFSLRIKISITRGQEEFYARISHLLER